MSSQLGHRTYEVLQQFVLQLLIEHRSRGLLLQAEQLLLELFRLAALLHKMVKKKMLSEM